MNSSRADLHCHSTASQVSKLGVQRALGLPECATPPEEVYALAKRRGMDFVTITDHDTIAGVLEIADRPDVFVSEELTARFRGRAAGRARALLRDHAGRPRLAAGARGRRRGRSPTYLHEHEITCALAHPFYAVEAPLTPRHRRRLAQLFGIWEVRNGSRARELNHPAAIYVETHGGIGIGGSDDHAGVDIGRTWSATPPRRDAGGVPRARPRRAGERARRAGLGREVGARRDGAGDPRARPRRAHRRARPGAVLRMVERVMTEGDARSGSIGDATSVPRTPEPCCARGSTRLSCGMSERDLLALLQSDGFSHADLERRARRCHERRLAATRWRARSPSPAQIAAAAAGRLHGLRRGDPVRARGGVPRPREGQAGRARRRAGRGSRWSPTAIGGMHGVTHTIDEIRERGVPGFEVEVIGTDPHVDRRLSAVAEVEIPFYPGLQGRRAEPARGRRRAGRGPLRRPAPVLARARRAWPRR